MEDILRRRPQYTLADVMRTHKADELKRLASNASTRSCRKNTMQDGSLCQKKKLEHCRLRDESDEGQWKVVLCDTYIFMARWTRDSVNGSLEQFEMLHLMLETMWQHIDIDDKV